MNKQLQRSANHIMLHNIHENTPVTMDKGLCGIAWGLCTLLENDFLEGDADEILTDMDHEIMERDPRQITDLSFNTGLEGIWNYVQTRVSFAEKMHCYIFKCGK